MTLAVTLFVNPYGGGHSVCSAVHYLRSRFDNFDNRGGNVRSTQRSADPTRNATVAARHRAHAAAITRTTAAAARDQRPAGTDANGTGARSATFGAARLTYNRRVRELDRQCDGARASFASAGRAGGESGIWFCPPSSSQT